MSRACVYRHFDAAGRLLYVGCALNPLMRLGGHATASPWLPLVANMGFEWFDTHEAALAAERKAIATENPVHNRRLTRRPHSTSPRRAKGPVGALVVASGIPRKEICRRAGISPQMLSSIESGFRSPSVRAATSLALALGVEPAAIRPDLAALVVPTRSPRRPLSVPGGAPAGAACPGSFFHGARHAP